MKDTDFNPFKLFGFATIFAFVAYMWLIMQITGLSLFDFIVDYSDSMRSIYLAIVGGGFWLFIRRTTNALLFFVILVITVTFTQTGGIVYEVQDSNYIFQFLSNGWGLDLVSFCMFALLAYIGFKNLSE
ncbi:hypothetical protein [Vibrio sp. D431a]|uniref:hypothetical protein n=1 Tax=Vibrio sp. D431a TaxID=2837388 RepID=UPI00255279D8|nr:hypothetical protein [Vibrio sp. D431a]MDK9793339.1 hypothetical protein [Vibrio sp. D431a]